MASDLLNETSGQIVQSAVEIHRALGPGLLESVYQACLVYELRARRLNVETEQIVRIRYKHLVLDGAYRIDLLVEDAVVVELKSVEVVLPVHYAQLLSYLRLTGKKLGLLINFNVPCLVKGVKRVVNGF